MDLDGTLLTSQRLIADEDLNSLLSLKDKGYLVVVATGRSNYSFSKLLDNLGYSGGENILPVDYVIFSTGAGIMDFPQQKLLQSSSLKARDVKRSARYLKKSALDFMIHRPVPDTRHFLYSKNGGDNPDFSRRLEMYGDFAELLSDENLEKCDGATEILCIVPKEKGHLVAQDIAVALSYCNVIKATSPLDCKSIWIEIFAPTVSKSQAVKWLAGQISVPRSKICAVGNDYNDEDLLRWAGRSYLVGNAPLSLKQIFPTVASNDSCGVKDAAALWLQEQQRINI